MQNGSEFAAEVCWGVNMCNKPTQLNWISCVLFNQESNFKVPIRFLLGESSRVAHSSIEIGNFRTSPNAANGGEDGEEQQGFLGPFDFGCSE